LRLYDHDMTTSSDAETRLGTIRDHCDRGLRYYAWALKRMPSILEQVDQIPQVTSSMFALALVLAYADGAETEREALRTAGDITSRYNDAVESEEWQPQFGPRS
jgi:hypothetical protein